MHHPTDHHPRSTVADPRRMDLLLHGIRIGTGSGELEARDAELAESRHPVEPQRDRASARAYASGISTSDRGTRPSSTFRKKSQ